MPPVGFEPTLSAGERLQTYALDPTAAGTGLSRVAAVNILPDRSSVECKREQKQTTRMLWFVGRKVRLHCVIQEDRSGPVPRGPINFIRTGRYSWAARSSVVPRNAAAAAERISVGA